MTWQNNPKGQANNEIIRSAWWVDVNINISSASSVKILLDLIYWYRCACFCLYMHIVSFSVLFNFVGAKGLFWSENTHKTCWCETLQILCLVSFEMTNAASSKYLLKPLCLDVVYLRMLQWFNYNEDNWKKYKLKLIDHS